MIIVVEPQCNGFEHVKFNAAFLSTLALVCPQDEIRFFSEASHATAVRSACEAHSAGSIRLRTEPIPLSWSSQPWWRSKQESNFCSQFLQFAASGHARLVVFSSVTAGIVLALKRLLPQCSYSNAVIAVPHGVLLETRKQGKRFWNWPMQFSAALRARCPSNLHLVALSRLIHDNMLSAFPQNNWAQMDHPLLACGNPLPARPGGRALRIGVFGALRNRLDDLCSLLLSIHNQAPDLEIVQVGHLRTADSRELGRLLSNPNERPLSEPEYSALASSVDYSVMLADPLHYRYAASATLLECFEYQVPFLAAQHALAEQYLKDFGDIGDCFSSSEDLAQAILSAAREFPTRRHNEQRDRLFSCCKAFAPSRLATRLSGIIESVEHRRA